MAKKRRSKDAQAQTREYNKQYYLDNKDRLAEEKAAKYQADPEYRNRMQQTARRRYWFGTRPETQSKLVANLPQVSADDLPPKGTISVTVNNAADVRYGQAVEVPVFSTAALETLLGRNGYTIRAWLKEGILPEPYFRGRMLPGVRLAKGRNPRLFTLDELRALEACRPNLALPSHGKKHDIFTRCVAERFAWLVQGLALKT